MQEIVEEIGHEIQIPARFQITVKIFQVLHTQESTPPVLVLRPWIGKVNVEGINAGSRQLFQQVLGPAADNVSVGQPEAVDLTNRFCTSAVFEIDPNQAPVGMLFSIGGEKMSVSAADFDFEGSRRRQPRPKAPCLFQSENPGYDLFSPFFRARFTVIRRPRSLLPESLEMAEEA